MDAPAASPFINAIFVHAVDARHCHSSHIAVLPVAPDWLQALAGLATAAADGDVLDLPPLSQAHTARVHALFDAGAPVLRVGPVISLSKNFLPATQELQVENFLRLPLAERHKGPNLLVFNLAQQSIGFEWMPASVQLLFPQHFAATDAASRPRFAPLGELPATLRGQATQALALPPGHVLLMPPDLVFHRLCAEAGILAARGFFQMPAAGAAAHA
jgi:hypothetical protein